MIATTKFLKPEEMNVEITLVMTLGEASKLVEGLAGVKLNWVADDLRLALTQTVRQVEQKFSVVQPTLKAEQL